MAWYTYMLQCKDGSLYTGVTTDLTRRLNQHNEGTGAKYTAARRPVTIVWSELADDESSAKRREAAIKQLPRNEKLKLIAHK